MLWGLSKVLIDVGCRRPGVFENMQDSHKTKRMDIFLNQENPLATMACPPVDHWCEWRDMKLWSESR